jgi:hypothetical protein
VQQDENSLCDPDEEPPVNVVADNKKVILIAVASLPIMVWV